MHANQIPNYTISSLNGLPFLNPSTIIFIPVSDGCFWLLRRLVLPDPGHTVSRSTRQMYPAPRKIDGNDAVLVTLEHELGLPICDIPKLDRAVFGT